MKPKQIKIDSKSRLTGKLASLSDVDAISSLNKKWLKKGDMKIDKKAGFLFGDALSKEDLKTIIENRELIVSYDQNTLAGYYLLDNYSKTTILSEHKKYIASCVAHGLISKNSKISKRMQCVVDEEYQMQGLSKLMFNELLKNTSSKYDLLFATVSKHNPKYAAHLRSGWEIIDEIDEVYLLTYRVTG
ncbi:MAG: hypothetical protein GQ574_03960 [Crocinitomix sp.]|nr:hypothetical protein [Crocinitomix sp.]